MSIACTECNGLSCTGSKLNELDEDGYSPLHLTVAHGQYGCVKMLLQLGAKVNIKNRWVELTASGCDQVWGLHSKQSTNSG